MTEISEEQSQELEALEAIYPNEITILSREKGNVRFTIRLKISDNDVEQNEDNEDSEETEEDDNEFSIGLEFILPEEYPNDVPSILVYERSRNLMLSDEEELLNLLNEEAKNSLGYVMISNLVTIGSEWLNKRKDEDELRRKEAEERRLKQLEEEENRKFEGTRVTVESFMKWKLAFDEEMSQLRRQKEKDKEKDIVGKLSGRQLFEKDRTLNESDLKFLEEEDHANVVSFDDQGVKVDTSLFEDDDEDFE